MRVQPAFRPLIVWQYRAEERPECIAVRPVLQVGKFMDDDVFQHPLGREDEPPVDMDRAARPA